ncbi:MAG TPA: DoxX family protein [Polyangia bacterium]|jgi:putative oxidoreductase|nr:DoxX family protein [Polyangia bacterium]
MIESFGKAAGSSSLGLVLPRAALGSTMVFHGVQKLREPEKIGAGFEALGISPGPRWARATGLAETFAGAAAILGVLTRPAALAVLTTQSIAVAKVHRKNGFDTTKGGFEWNLTLMAVAAGLLVAGPGRLSVHRGIARSLPRRRRWRWGRIAAALLG